MLATAIDAEVAEWIDSYAHLTNDAGHRQVVRTEKCGEYRRKKFHGNRVILKQANA